MLSDIKPFQMYGNLYFVGSSRVSVHLIKTQNGLVLIDSGYPDMYSQIAESINALGFSVKDICAIFHSHGHIDHTGCTQMIKKQSGATTYISRIDNEIINGNRDLSWAKELNIPPQPPFSCDVLVEDGDTFSFGNTAIRCVLTSGHTDGVLSFFVNLTNGSEEVTAAMHGGIGMNSMTAEYLKANNLPFSCRQAFREGLHKLAAEHVDLVMGNHPEQNDTAGKLNKLQNGAKTIVDPTEWGVLLKTAEDNLDKLMYAEKQKGV